MIEITDKLDLIKDKIKHFFLKKKKTNVKIRRQVTE